MSCILRVDYLPKCVFQQRQQISSDQQSAIGPVSLNPEKQGKKVHVSHNDQNKTSFRGLDALKLFPGGNSQKLA